MSKRKWGKRKNKKNTSKNNDIKKFKREMASLFGLRVDQVEDILKKEFIKSRVDEFLRCAKKEN